MTMALMEAQALQYRIADTHPHLEVSIKKVGADNSDEWVCFIETHIYYLWDEDDWIAYRTKRAIHLEKYTEKGRRIAIEKQRLMQARQTTIT